MESDGCRERERESYFRRHTCVASMKKVLPRLSIQHDRPERRRISSNRKRRREHVPLIIMGLILYKSNKTKKRKENKKISGLALGKGGLSRPCSCPSMTVLVSSRQHEMPRRPLPSPLSPEPEQFSLPCYFGVRRRKCFGALMLWYLFRCEVGP